MIKYVICLPSAYQPFTDACLKTLAPELRVNTLLIDNTKDNRGVPHSWNMGIDHLKRTKADWLILLSAAIRFGAQGGKDFIKTLDDHPDHYAIHGATANVKGGMQQDGDNGGGGKNGIFGWHLTAFSKSVFDRIGRFDENFWPAYYEDIDWSLRLQKAFKPKGWDTYPCDVTDTMMAHALHFTNIANGTHDENNRAYFARKWGRTVKDWQNMGYATPFNDPDNSLAYWPAAATGGKWDD